MERCDKCGKVLGEYLLTAYGEKRCADCWDDYLTTDKGKVEYFLGIARGDFPIEYYDADFLGWLSVCWRKHRDELDMKMSEVKKIEDKARELGLL